MSYTSRARQEGFGGRADRNGFTQRPRTSTYGANPKNSSFAESSPFTRGYGSGRHASPDNAGQLYKADHHDSPKATTATGHTDRPAPKTHDGHLKSSNDCCWDKTGWRHAVTTKEGKG